MSFWVKVFAGPVCLVLAIGFLVWSAPTISVWISEDSQRKKDASAARVKFEQVVFDITPQLWVYDLQLVGESRDKGNITAFRDKGEVRVQESRTQKKAWVVVRYMFVEGAVSTYRWRAGCVTGGIWVSLDARLASKEHLGAYVARTGSCPERFEVFTSSSPTPHSSAS